MNRHFWLLLMAAALPALAQDMTPPVLTSFSFSPAAVDTTTSSATVTGTAQITDDLSGAGGAFARFTSPSGNQGEQCSLNLISGTNLNGAYQCSMTIPAYAEGGTWTVSYVFVVDNVGNYQYYYTSDLMALGFPTTLQVTSQQDTTPPVLPAFSFSPAAVDTTTSSATVMGTAQITDDLSGVSGAFARFTSPSGNQGGQCSLNLISGTNLNGTYQCSITIPAYAEGGAWTVSYVFLVDNVGNYKDYSTSDLAGLGFPTTLQVTSQQDTIPPGLTAFSFSPVTVDTTTSPATVTGTAQITDDLSGVSGAFARFNSPSGDQGEQCSLNLISGTNLNGTYQCSMTIPAFAESGIWTVAYVFVVDNVGNYQSYYTSDLQNLGFPVSLGVDVQLQTITFAPLPNQPFGTAPFTVSATASSGLPVSFASLTTGVCTVSGNAVTLVALGTCTIQATQAGDSTYGAAMPVNQSFQVTQGSQTISFGALGDQTYGAGPFAVSATASSGLAVSFASTTGTVCSVSGATVSVLAAGTCTIQATQAGNADYAAAPPVSQSFQVIQATTTTDGNSSPNPSMAGQTVTFTATVTGQLGGAVTGSVSFMQGSTTLGTAPVSGGMAVLMYAKLTPGTYSITAVYGGDANSTGSTSSAIRQAVARYATSTAVTSSPNPSPAGEKVTFTATVSTSSMLKPTGMVTFVEGTSTLGTAKLSGGQASFSTSALTAGQHAISAVYNGTAIFAGSLSATITQTVNKDATTLTLMVNPNPSTYGQSVTCTATVSSTLGAPPNGEVVTFYNGGTSLGTAALSGGSAQLTTSALAGGSQTVMAGYAGDTNYRGSMGSVTQTVNPAATTTVLTSSPNPSSVGQTVVFTATVSSSPGLTPTGTVVFFEGTTVLGTGTLSGGVATLSSSSLTKGNHTFTAEYSQTTDFAKSVSAAITQVVK